MRNIRSGRPAAGRPLVLRRFIDKLRMKAAFEIYFADVGFVDDDMIYNQIQEIFQNLIVNGCREFVILNMFAGLYRVGQQEGRRRTDEV